MAAFPGVFLALRYAAEDEEITADLPPCRVFERLVDVQFMDPGAAFEMVTSLVSSSGPQLGIDTPAKTISTSPILKKGR